MYGSSGQAMSCSASHGSPDSLAAATQPNQIGQLYGSVSGSPAQPVSGGRPSPDTRYQRKPSASVGPPATKDSAPFSSDPRRSLPSPGASRTVRSATVVATTESAARSGCAGNSAEAVAAALALGLVPVDAELLVEALALGEGDGVSEAEAVPSSRVRTNASRMTVSTASTTTPMIIARGARRDGPVGVVVGPGGGAGGGGGGYGSSVIVPSGG